MGDSELEKLTQAIAVTAELTATAMSKQSIRALVSELAQYDLPGVLAALARCRREVQAGRFCMREIAERIPGAHISDDEAWALVPKDEKTTAVVTQQMLTALAAAQPLLEAGDKIGARMAFKHAYERLISEECGQRPIWIISMGWEPKGRLESVMRAVELGRITAAAAQEMLPQHRFDIERQLAGHEPQKSLGFRDLMDMASARAP